jgi:hypothetical protein
MADEVTFLRMDPGYARDWHPAPAPPVRDRPDGEVEVTVTDGQSRRFGPGGVFLAEDTTGQGHRTRAVGAGGSSGAWVAFQ